jgi:hypothetical protein
LSALCCPEAADARCCPISKGKSRSGDPDQQEELT